MTSEEFSPDNDLITTMPYNSLTSNIHYELLKRNLAVTAERYCQQLRRLEEPIQQKRPG
jgi:hypothetical protein